MKADVLLFLKMWYFLGLAVFKVELLAAEVGSKLKKNDRKAVLKKSHGHNFWILHLKFNHALDIYISEGVIQFQIRNPKIVAVTFFLTPPICGDAFNFAGMFRL